MFYSKANQVKTKVKKRKTRTDKQKAKDKAWRSFSDYIRTRDSLKTTSTLTRCVCITCGKTVPYKRIHAGHGIGGRTNSILFDEKLVNGQCDSCNVFHGGEYEIYASKLIEMYGIDMYNEFLAKKKRTVKYTTQDYIDISIMYKNKRTKLVTP